MQDLAKEKPDLSWSRGWNAEDKKKKSLMTSFDSSYSKNIIHFTCYLSILASESFITI